MVKSNKNLLIALFALLVLITVFTLPLFVPVFKATVSASYNYQFNNLIAVLAMCGCLLAALIACFKFYNSAITSSINDLFTPSDTEKLKSKHLYIAFGVFLVFIGFLYTIGADYGYGEGNYFLLRVDRIKLGQVPYRDFEYAYGMLLIYLPAMVSKLLGMSTPNAYYLCYLAFNFTGIYFLYFTANHLNINYKAKRLLFYNVVFCSLPFYLGVNYTLIRFLTPFVCLLAINGLIGKYQNTSKYVFTVAIASFALVLLNLLISIEVGIAIGLAVLAYFYLSAIMDKSRANFIVALVFTTLLVVLAYIGSDNLLLILKVFGSGGNNFPVVPSPSIVLYVLSFLVINAVFASLVFKKQLYFLTFTLVGFSVVMLPGAFGRCDPGHIFWYGLSTFICMWAYLAYTNSKWYKAYSIAFVLIFTVGYNAGALFMYRGQLASATARYIVTHPIKNTLDKALAAAHVNPAKLDDYVNKYKPVTQFAGLDKYAFVATPFDADKDLYQYLLDKKKFVPEYYTGLLLNVYTPEQIATKLKVLQDDKHAQMIVPQPIYNYKVDHSVTENKFISMLFLYPFTYKKKQYSEDLYNPIYQYIQTYYEVVETYGDQYYLVKRVGRRLDM